jgi:hypothetical protein
MRSAEASAAARSQIQPTANVRPVQPVQPVDPYDAVDQDFDFQAGQRAAAAIMQRDHYQMMLAENSDAKSGSGVPYSSVIAAYREFD